MDSDSSNSAGITRYFQDLLLATLSYLRARLELAGIEGKEAFAQIGGVLVLSVLSITLIMAGYFLLCLALVFGLARLISSDNAWIWIAAITGLTHLFGAWAVLRGARGLLRKPMFPSTIEEFRKDETWLKSTAGRPR